MCIVNMPRFKCYGICLVSPTLVGLRSPPTCFSLPLVVREVRFYSKLQIIVGSFKVNYSNIVVMDFARCHKTSDLALAELFFLAVDGPR